jgi:hypothetical protein
MAVNQQPPVLPVAPAGPAGIQQPVPAQPPQVPFQPAPQPPAPPGQPQQPVAQPGQLPAQPPNYRSKYLDPTTDRFSGNFANLYNEYMPGNTTPANLRDALYRDGNTGSLLHVLLHVRLTTAGADDPGTIVAYHRLSRRDTGFGQQPTSYDNQGLAFFGDVVNQQVPLTVHLPDTIFNQMAPVQVPTGPRWTQLFAAQAGDALFGPFAAGEADVEPVTTRAAVVVPNRYVVPFLSNGMAPRAAYLALSGMIHQDGNEVACEPLLHWLRVAMTRRAAGQMPRTCLRPLVTLAFVNPLDQQGFGDYRARIAQDDIPPLRPGMQHNSALLITQGIGNLTAEQRLTRQEAADARADKAAPKTPQDYFGALTERLMRWCQVQREEDLPPIYEKIANAKKGRIRSIIQTDLEEILENSNYMEDFPISSTLATKITELRWHSKMKNDFTVGLNIFSFGSLDELTMEEQRRLNKTADMVSGGDAAPSLKDVTMIEEGKHDLCIPKFMAECRYCIERSKAMWHLLMGPLHPATIAHDEYRTQLIALEKKLTSVLPRNPRHRYLLPALLARVVQLETNHWFDRQSKSAQPIAFPDLLEVFNDIERDRMWEPTFPEHYLLTPAPSTPADISLGTSATDMSSMSTLTEEEKQRRATPSESSKNTMVRNMNYKAKLFGKFKALGIASKKLKEAVKERGVEYPKNEAGHIMCMPWHVQGLCNKKCQLAEDHKEHTDSEDNLMCGWCETDYKLN